MALWVALLVALAAALLATSVSLLQRTQRLREEIERRQARLLALEQELGPLKRQLLQLEAEQSFLTRFLTELPHLARELHTGATVRRIPDVLLNILSRSLEPEQALVLLRRRRAHTDPSRDRQLVVAAALPAEGKVRTGTAVAIGQGELGFVAEVQRTMSRNDLELQSPTVRNRLRAEGLPGFAPELAAPMVFQEETVGLLAVSGVRQKSADAKAVMRLIAQIGALALHDVAAYTEMKVTADVDGLTRVLNKRCLTQRLAEAIVTAAQDVSPISVFLFDIDNFKHYNDTNGHVAGDTLLQMLARLVMDNTRRESVFGRFGGEEFLLILPGVAAEQALGAAEKVRAAIAAHPFPFAAQQPLGCLSVSGGVAEYPTDAQDSVRLLRAADAALYRAKHEGRNRVLRVEPAYLSEGGDA